MIAFGIPGRIARSSCAALLALLAVVQPVAGQNGDPKRWTVDDAMALKGVGEVAVSPDGKRIAYVVTERNTEANVTNSDVWIVSATGGDARRVTSGPRADRAPQWSNDGSWIAFLSDRADNRRMQVFGIDPGGEAWQITRHETLSRFLCPRRQVFRTSRVREQDLDKARERPSCEQRLRGRLHATLGGALRNEPSNGHAVSRKDACHFGRLGPDSRAIAFGASPQPTLVANARGGVHPERARGRVPRDYHDARE
jgi:hypothetical protein